MVSRRWQTCAATGFGVRKLDTISVVIAAPQRFVYGGLSAFGRPSPVWEPGGEPEVVENCGSVLTVAFHTSVMGRTRNTLWRVRLYPPSRLTYELLEGMRGAFREEITLTPVDDRTRLEYCGDIRAGFGPAGWAAERLVLARMFNHERQRTIKRYRITLEAAATAAGLVDLSRVPASGNGANTVELVGTSRMRNAAVK
jgi:hypothetical protein